MGRDAHGPGKVRCGRADGAHPRQCQRGTALLLIPVGVLVVTLLGSITVDSAAAFLATREAESVASSLANDLASLALDEAALRRHGVYRLDPSRMPYLSSWSRRTAEDRLSGVFDPDSIEVTARAAAPTAVHVTVSGSARRIIGLIGNVDAPSSRHVSAEATASVFLSGSG